MNMAMVNRMYTFLPRDARPIANKATHVKAQTTASMDARDCARKMVPDAAQINAKYRPLDARFNCLSKMRHKNSPIYPANINPMVLGCVCDGMSLVDVVAEWRISCQSDIENAATATMPDRVNERRSLFMETTESMIWHAVNTMIMSAE